MSNKAIILIDMDGPLCHWVRDAIRRYRIMHPDLPFIEESDVSMFHLEKCWPEEHVWALRNTMNSPRFYHNLTPVEGASEAMADIADVARKTGKIEPFICSSPWLHAHEMDSHSGKAIWVEEKLGRYWTEKLILSKDKTLVRGHFLIDDKPDITGALTPTWQQLLYDCTWNRNADPEINRFTWADWPQLRDTILASF